MKYDIFVSYRRSDRELVASVVKRLEARGVAVWYDAEIEGGADWREVIVEALSNSDMLAIFFSEDANNSRQLKKELAVADKLNKAVVPILIEDTQPRGAYLYELADRNWIQAFPDPMEKIEELVEHLATLAGKDGLLGMAAPKTAANDAGPSAGSAVESGAGRSASPPWAAPAPAGSEPAREAEQPLTEALEEFIEGGYDSAAAPPPKIAKAYVGRVSESGKRVRPLNDILPFRWIDLVVLVPLIGAWAWALSTFEVATGSDDAVADVAAHVFLALLPVALYGALVFPVRYYLRKRPLVHALTRYLLSSFILYAIMMTGFFAMKAMGMLPFDDPAEMALLFGIAWIPFTLIAFLVYGVLAGQRAIRSFRSNIRKI